jgi:sugar lactone lactonase YvrE
LNIVVKIDPSGIATVVAGTGEAGYSGDGGPAIRAQLNFPSGLAMDGRGNLYVADSDNNVIREIGANGVIRTVVGSGVPGLAGDGGPATRARLLAPSGLAFADRMLYIADQQNDRVRRVDPSGVITTIAGK